jgi:hypothetical protein
MKQWLLNPSVYVIGATAANMFPLKLQLPTHGRPEPNSSNKSTKYLRVLGTEDDDFEHLFYHVVAALYSPTYRTDNASALRQNWPRIPLPGTKELLLHSAQLGRALADLLDLSAAIQGIVSGRLRSELAQLRRSPAKAGAHSILMLAAWT